MATEEKREWFRVLVQIPASVLPAIAPRVLLCCAFSLVVSGLATRGWPVSLPIESSIVPSLVLGLLLVFRTNTAYERFWPLDKTSAVTSLEFDYF
ncbi:MAG: hypothetical protein F6J87_19885 [Spirulina sp. SIO3F2]|nr:hypothetical protein [Spirulina sp. SIO3F2]